MYRTYDLDVIFMIMDKNAKRPVSHTFRIEPDSYELLEKEAKKKSVSINMTLNQMIKEHAFKVNFDKIDSTLTPNDALKGLFELVDDKEIIQLAKS